MKHYILSAALLTGLSLAACAPPASETEPPAAAEVVSVAAPSGEYKLDKTHASVTVRVPHFGLSNYTLRFTSMDATLNFNAEDPAASSVSATVNIPSIETDYFGERNFDAELQNSDWLNAAEYPVASFQSTSIEMTGARTAVMTGDLTVRGQTHPATFDVTYNNSFAQHPMGFPVALVGFSAKGVIKRSDYGVSQFVPEEGSVVGVGDDVELLIEVEFQKPVEAAANGAEETASE